MELLVKVDGEEVAMTSTVLSARNHQLWFAMNGTDVETREALYVATTTKVQVLPAWMTDEGNVNMNRLWRITNWPTWGNWSETYPQAWSDFRLRSFTGTTVALKSRLVEWTVGDRGPKYDARTVGRGVASSTTFRDSRG